MPLTSRNWLLHSDRNSLYLSTMLLHLQCTAAGCTCNHTHNRRLSTLYLTLACFHGFTPTSQLADDAVNESNWQSISVQLAGLQYFTMLICCKALLLKASDMPAMGRDMIITITTVDIVIITAAFCTAAWACSRGRSSLRQSNVFG